METLQNLSVGFGLRWSKERFDVQFRPFMWDIGFTSMGVHPGVEHAAVLAVGPIHLKALTHPLDYVRAGGPALIFHSHVLGWTIEVRIIPLLWRIRRKPGFLSIGPFKLIWTKWAKVGPDQWVMEIGPEVKKVKRAE